MYVDETSRSEIRNRERRSSHKVGRPSQITVGIVPGIIHHQTISRRQKIADGFVQNARAEPARRLSVVGISQIRRSNANANLIDIGVVHKNVGDGSAPASLPLNVDCRRVCGVGLNQMLFVLNELYDPVEPCNLVLTESMSLEFVLENKGERETNWFVGLLAV